MTLENMDITHLLFFNECAVPMVHSGDLKVNGSGGEVIIHKVCFFPEGLSWCPSIVLSLL